MTTALKYLKSTNSNFVSPTMANSLCKTRPQGITHVSCIHQNKYLVEDNEYNYMYRYSLLACFIKGTEKCLHI